MDKAQLTELTQQTLTILGPLIAGGALVKIGENATDATADLARRVWAAIQSRLAGDKKGEATLTLYEDGPEDPTLQRLLTQQLIVVLERDPVAVQELAELVRQLQARLDDSGASKGRSHTQNISGNAQVGTAIAGDVHGGLTIGPVSFGAQPTAQGAARTTGALSTVSTTLSPEEQQRQLDLLGRYRDNLHHLLRQAANAGGEEAIVVAIANDIAAQREAIARIKATLHASGIAVANLPDDEPTR